MKKKIFLIMTMLLILLSFANISFAAKDELTNKITKGLSTVQSWIVKIATPAAAVAIGSGLLIKKFSFGDEEKITMGKRLIRSSIFSYAFILLIDPVISAIQSLFG